MKRINYIVILLIMVVPVFSQTTTENYIVKKTYTQNDNTTAISQIQYFDGLGRPVETVIKAYTPLGKDFVSTTVYDAVGREWQQWLPAASANNDGSFVNVNGFKATQQAAYGNDANPYNQTNYESSPLNRVAGQFGAGALWHSNNKQNKTDYQANAANDVAYFYVENNILKRNGFYNINTLYVTKATDEDGNESYEFKDKLGRVILTRQMNGTDKHNTYYVYNDLNQKCFVLPPLVADQIISSGATTFTDATHPVLKQYAYTYLYDEKGNCIYKRLPGCFPIFMVYDIADRLVLSQDGNQRKKLQNGAMQWTVTKYDILGRMIFVGLTYRSETDTSQNYLSIRNTIKNQLIVEEYNGSSTFGYSTNFFAEAIPLNIKYYDNYNFLDKLTTNEKSNLNYVSPGSADYGTRYTDSNGNVNARGLLTGTRVYILDNVISSYLATAIYYDEKGQVVQSRSTNHLNGYDFTYNGYNFAGQILKTKHTHSSATRQPIDEITTNIYDNAGRLKTVKYKIGGYTDDVILSSYTYDELGRVVGNMRHNSTDSELFEYNIRNWSTKITSGTFVEKILYNKDLPSQATARYNGNIAFSSVISGGGRALGYTYTYDNLNRLRLATGYSVSPTTGALTAYGYNEEFNYDKQGNINFLQRKTSTTLMDYLGFTYNGNQITAIIDYTGSQNIYDIKEYNNNNTSGYDFAYDNNGNMLVDKDRKIVAIRYNLLNLPDIIQFSNGNQIKNRYAADGRKLGTENYTQLTALSQPLTEGTILNQTYQANVVDQTGTAYVGNFEYKTYWNVPLYTTLKKVFNSEGYVDEFNNNQTYSGFVYYRRDHLGNNCEVWRAGKAGGTAAATLQRTRYYPSGLPWNYTTGYAPTAQQYKYNGKEFIEMHALDEYDSEARHYYPTIGRTTTIDPLAEKYYSISPYAWCGNNPVNDIDPDGMKVKNGNEKKRIMVQEKLNEAQENFNNNYSSEKLRRNDFKSRKKFVKYKNDLKNLSELRSAFTIADANFNKTNQVIDEYKTTDPEGFKLIDNLTNTVTGSSIDVIIEFGYLNPAYGGAATSAVYPESIKNQELGGDGNIHIKFDGTSKLSSGETIAHEFGHSVFIANSPYIAKLLNISWIIEGNFGRNISCQNPQNRDEPTVRTAMDWQENYQKLLRTQQNR